jgi:hypothetical protein
MEGQGWTTGCSAIGRGRKEFFGRLSRVGWSEQAVLFSTVADYGRGYQSVRKRETGVDGVR